MKPFAIIEKNGEINYYNGEIIECDSLDDLENIRKRTNRDVVFVLPFCSIREKGMDAEGNEPILALSIESIQNFTREEVLKTMDPAADITVEGEIISSVTDESFSDQVRAVQKEEIAGGNASQVILSRRFAGQINMENSNLPDALKSLYARLLHQKGQYMTILFSDGGNRNFVGATPERHLEITADGQVFMNPIAGTMPKGALEDFPERLDAFLEDGKEINELCQVLDEELKMIARICPGGGKISGPFLRESGAVFHTEYLLAGSVESAGSDYAKMLRHTLFAPTLVGSPLKSAARIIARREEKSREYYGGAIGVLGGKGLDSAILIRTAQVKSDGKFSVQAGAGIVRDSVPEKEADETRRKAEGFLKILKHSPVAGQSETNYLKDVDAEELKQKLESRNARLSRFHFENQSDLLPVPELNGKKVLIINNEDDFAYMIGHMAARMGCETTVTDTFGFDAESTAADIVIIGPGPGDINDQKNPRIKRLLECVAALRAKEVPVLGICLGHQALAACLGLEVKRQQIPTQGEARQINLFGHKEYAGFYNSFSPIIPGKEHSHKYHHIEMSSDENNRIIAMRARGMIGVQFHPESVMTENGYDLLKEYLIALSSA